jgi:heme/copper-type cytochrome/quinol oxidase subunit 4
MSEPFVGNTDPQQTATPQGQADHGPNFQAYITVFLVLCVLTLTSFLVALLGHGFDILGVPVPAMDNHATMLIILGVSVVKATLVAMIFMHLKSDWPKLYCIIVPVCVMGVMMIIVLLPDIVLSWHQYFYDK